MNYKYIAINNEGKYYTRAMEADNVRSVVLALKSEGIAPLKVYEVKKAKSSGFFNRKRVTNKEIVVFTRQLAATLNAGLVLTEALTTIGEDVENPYFHEIITKIGDDIKAGSDFSQSLTKYPKVFNITYVAMMRSGEATGRLDKMCMELAKYLEDMQRLREKVVTAMRYPLFVLGFAIFVVMIIVLFLIPKFQDLFDGAGAELPLLTRIVVSISNFSIAYFPWVFLGCVLLWIASIYALKQPKIKRTADILKFKIPIMGKLIIYKSCLSTFCRTLSALIHAGVGLSKALEICGQVVDHMLMSEKIENVRQGVLAGSNIADELRDQKIFTALVVKMTAVGEKTGKLAEMLKRTSEYYDEELENSLSRLTALLEPILIVFIGGIVLIVVLALYLPIFNISSAIK